MYRYFCIYFLVICGVFFFSKTNCHGQYNSIVEIDLNNIYVDPIQGNDSFDGSKLKPFKTVKKSLTTAMWMKKNNKGVKINLAPGVYREINPQNFALQINADYINITSAPLVIEGMGWNIQNPKNTGEVIITGAEDWSGGWQKNNDGTWSKPWPYKLGIPSKSAPFGVSDAFLRREWLYINEQTYYQLNPPNYKNKNGQVGVNAEAENASTYDTNGGRLNDDEGSFWIIEDSLEVSKIVIRPSKNLINTIDLNSKDNTIEVSFGKGLLQTYHGQQSTIPTNIILRNIVFKNSGSNSSIQHQNNFLIEDCKFIQSKKIALNFFKCSNGLVRRTEFSENGEAGLSVNGVQNTEFIDCKFSDNSRQAEVVGYQSWSVCGVKMYTVDGNNLNLKFKNCIASRNRGTGFWWDTGNVNGLMEGCKAEYNTINGAFIEANNDTKNSFAFRNKNKDLNEGTPNLGRTNTVVLDKCIFAHNGPNAKNRAYRKVKGRGIFLSENENALVKNCIIYDNDIQISTYDNRRGENRNNQFSNNIIAAKSFQRLYAIGSPWDSKEKFKVPEMSVQNDFYIKAGWMSFMDGFNVNTNNNLYFYPDQKAFFPRNYLKGTDYWDKDSLASKPSLTLSEWKLMHLNNSNNLELQKNVDENSALNLEPYNSKIPLVNVAIDSLSTDKGSYKKRGVKFFRVASQKIDKLTAVSFLLTGKNNKDSIVFKDTMEVNIPFNSNEVLINIDLEKLDLNKENYTLILELIKDKSSYYTTEPKIEIKANQIELERKEVNYYSDTPLDKVLVVNSNKGQQLRVRLPFLPNDASIKLKEGNRIGLQIFETGEHWYTVKPFVTLPKGEGELIITGSKEKRKFKVLIEN
jgi:hypothetical protein